jgi:ribosomal protein L21E
MVRSPWIKSEPEIASGMHRKRYHGQTTRIMTTVTIAEKVALPAAAGAEGTEDEDEP